MVEDYCEFKTIYSSEQENKINEEFQRQNGKIYRSFNRISVCIIYIFIFKGYHTWIMLELHYILKSKWKIF